MWSTPTVSVEKPQMNVATMFLDHCMTCWLVLAIAGPVLAQGDTGMAGADSAMAATVENTKTEIPREILLGGGILLVVLVFVMVRRVSHRRKTPTSVAIASARREITMKSTVEAIGQGIEGFDRFATETNIPTSIGRKAKTALDDVLNNVVSYAFEGEEDHEIRVSLEFEGGSLTVIVADDGIPFDPLAQSEPQTDQPLEERMIGGLGIHLVRNLTDELRYRRESDSNVLTMVFKVSPTGHSQENEFVQQPVR
jgi:anti-sigma regulatory factor (Ser/Thr protein kinase)